MSRTSSVLSNIFSIGHSYGNAWFRSYTGKLPILTTIKSVRDIDEDTTRSILETYAALNTKSFILDYLPSTNVPILKPVLHDISPSGSKTFSAYHNKDNKPIIELNTPTDGIKLDVSNHHGKFQGDVWFGGVSWSNDERYVAYTANAKDDKTATETLFDKNQLVSPNPNDNIDPNKSNSNSQQSKFDFKEDWGEKFEGVSNLVIGILDTHTGKVITLSANVNECTIGCPVFHSTNTHQLIFTKWNVKPRRLGIIHCHQRACSIHLVDLTQLLLASTTTITTDTKSPIPTTVSDFPIHSPSFVASAHPTSLTSALTVGRVGRFSPNGRHLVVLGRKKQAVAHNACYELYRIDLVSPFSADTVITAAADTVITSSAAPVSKLIVPIVYTPKSRADFPGLFVDQIPSRCFLDSDSHIILTSGWCSTDAVLKINIHTGVITKLNDVITNQLYSSSNNNDSNNNSNDANNNNNNGDGASYYALETVYDAVNQRSYISCSTSTPTSPSRIGILQFDHDTNTIVSGSSSGDVIEPVSTTTATVSNTISNSIDNIRVWRSVLPTRFLSVSNKIQFSTSSAATTTIQSSSSTPPAVTSTITQVREDIRQQLASMRWKVLSFYAVDNDNSVDNKKAKQCKNINSSRYECILLLPPSPASTAASVSLPLIIVPHGGPHSCLTTQFLPAYSFLSLTLTAALLLVNYRGSTNFGQTSIDSLLGKIGTNDVADIVQCVEELIREGVNMGDNEGSGSSGVVKFDATKVSIVGGSHGGFLGGHIIGQYPTLCSSAVLRNPVTNIPSMTTFSDIPDWCFVESGGADGYDFSDTAPTRNPTATVLSLMAAQSPVAYIDSVKTPTLLCLGRQDKRVPSGQGVEYYHLLRSRGVSVRLLSFPEDTHGIERPVSEAEQWVATAHWIQQHFV